jgi:hypothetical protein
MVIVHMPPVRSGWYGPIKLAAMLKPLLNGKNIALMMSGHTHRESYDPPSKDGFDFPILINSNNTRLEVKVEGRQVVVNVVKPDGTVNRQIKL